MPIGYVDVLANGTPMTSSPGAAQTPRIRPVQPLARPSNSAERERWPAVPAAPGRSAPAAVRNAGCAPGTTAGLRRRGRRWVTRGRTPASGRSDQHAPGVYVAGPAAWGWSRHRWREPCRGGGVGSPSGEPAVPMLAAGVVAIARVAACAASARSRCQPWPAWSSGGGGSARRSPPSPSSSPLRSTSAEDGLAAGRVGSLHRVGDRRRRPGSGVRRHPAAAASSTASASSVGARPRRSAPCRRLAAGRRRVGRRHAPLARRPSGPTGSRGSTSSARSMPTCSATASPAALDVAVEPGPRPDHDGRRRVLRGRRRCARPWADHR